jgi:hypothetical protein
MDRLIVLERLFFIALIAVAIILAMVWHFGRSSSLLRQWAEENGYRIVRKRYRNFFKGPFFWTSTSGQTVYYVTVEDDAGNRRSGWARCGGWWFGLLSNHVEVRWDN